MALVDSFQFFLRSKRMSNHLMLCVMLSILYVKAEDFNYWRDRVVLKVKAPQYGDPKNLKDIEGRMLILPLASFCLMILHPNRTSKLNLNTSFNCKNQQDDLCVSPLIAFTSELELFNDPDYCCFILMQKYGHMMDENNMLVFCEHFDHPVWRYFSSRGYLHVLFVMIKLGFKWKHSVKQAMFDAFVSIPILSLRFILHLEAQLDEY